MRFILLLLCLPCSLSSRTPAGGVRQPQLHPAYAQLPLCHSKVESGPKARQQLRRFLARASALFPFRFLRTGLFSDTLAAIRAFHGLRWREPAARVEELEPLPGKTNYILSRDPVTLAKRDPEFLQQYAITIWPITIALI